MKRTSALASLAGFLSVPLLGEHSRATAQTKTPLRVITTPNEYSSGVFYADAHGSFAKYGLDATIQTLSSGEAAAVAVMGGSAEVGVANLLSLAEAHEKGLPITLIAPASEYINAAPTVALIVDQHSPFQSAADMAGKTIAVPAIGDLNTISTRAWLEKGGVNSKATKFLEVPTPQMAGLISKGTIDAAVMGAPSLTIALAQSCRILGLPYGAVASRMIINGWFASNTWLNANRDVAKRFALAVSEGQSWANVDRDGSAKVLVSALKIDPALVSKGTRVSYARRFEPALIQPLIDFAASFGVLRSSFRASDMYVQLL